MNATAILIPIAVAIIAALGAYLASARKLSGKIGTSDAAELWKESASIRQDYREELRLANERSRKLEESVDKLNDVNQLLALDNQDVRAQLGACQRELAQLKASSHE
jgi:hypothetical protein